MTSVNKYIAAAVEIEIERAPFSLRNNCLSVVGGFVCDLH